MKLLSLAVALCLVLTAQAKIWRVNNNVGITANFTTLQQANNDANVQNGDTVHLEPSLNSYGDLSLTKKLTIISIGQFNGINPNFQFSSAESFCRNIDITNANANGSVISVKYSGRLLVNSASVTNISFINCASTTPSNSWCDETGWIRIFQASNCIIQNCYAANIDVDNNAQNIIITNNIIGNSIQVTSNSSSIISNNVIHAVNFNNGCGIPTINNSQVKNNIFNKGLQASHFVNCNVTNNYAPNGNLPQVSGDGNVNNMDMTTVFTSANGGFCDNCYKIKSGSSALTAGDQGQEIGAFGGSSPFKLAVQPAIPSIYKLQIPATPSGNTMTAIFSTRSN